MKISAYWAGCDNFGDKLTEAILECWGIQAYYDERKYAKLCGVGTILNRFVTSQTTNYHYPMYVFGTGFDNYGARFDGFCRRLKIYAVRGEYTKQCIEKIYGEKISDAIVLGDMGLLVRKLIKKDKKKKYDLGIVPHYLDEDDIRFKQLRDKYQNSKILSVRETPDEFVRQLMECRYVISTAMHPLIACDALRIPNIWAYLPEANQVDMSVKFNDYYSAFGKKKKALILDDEGLSKDLVNEIKLSYDITDEMVDKKIKELEDAMDRMLMDMRHDKMSDIYWMCVSKTINKYQMYKGILKRHMKRT